MTDQLSRENLADFNHDDPQDQALPEELLPAALEALLFAAGDPLPLDKLAALTGLEKQALKQVLDALAERYQQDRHRGIMLREINDQYLLCTKPGLKDVLQRLFQPRHRPPLSQAAYEALAIIAYNQPVTRAQVETVRGVNSDSIISRLLERNLIRETGTLEAPGRPALFATTDQFLIDFGLKSVADLPPMEMLMYGTLRDFESSLDQAAGPRSDRQMTIDQLVSAFVPEHEDNYAIGTQAGGSLKQQHAGGKDREQKMPDQEVLDVSGALFGHTPEPDED